MGRRRLPAWEVAMFRIASVGAVVGSICLAAAPAWGEGHRQGRSSNVLERVDRILDNACACNAGAARCDCRRPERRVFEKLSGSRSSPQLPKDARYDASAGVFL
jgi:hypothetical protein